MSDRIVEAKNNSDEEPEEGEIQDDGFEDVSSDDEISAITRREESVMYSHSFVLHKVSNVKRQGLSSPRSDVRFHVPEKLDHISHTSQKRSRTGQRSGGHDYYEMFQRYNKSLKDHHSKGRVHEKENKARETKKLYKKSSVHNTIIESRSSYGGDHSEARYSSTSKGSWHQCEVKEKHKKKKKSKSYKSYPLGEVHESQMMCSKNVQVSEECLKTTMNMKEDKVCEKDEVEQEEPKLGDVQSQTSSDIEILDVPKKVPEVITIADSDDDGQLQNLFRNDTEFDISGNPSSEGDCYEPTELTKTSEDADSVTEFEKKAENSVATDSVTEFEKKAENSVATDSTGTDENLEFLREAALNSSKAEQSLHSNSDQEVLLLRLAALRSAIIRKFEERKKKGITLAKRGRTAEKRHTLSISPLSSPNHYSSGESVQLSEETDMYQPSEEVIVSNGSMTLQNDSEIDKITAIDMELVESDEEKEHVSIVSEHATSQNVTLQFTDDYNFPSIDSSVKNSNETLSLNDISEEILPNSALQRIFVSPSPLMAAGEFKSGETTSGHIIGNSEKQSSLISETSLPYDPLNFNSKLLSCDNNHFLEIDEQNKIQLRDTNFFESHKTEHHFAKENIVESYEDANNLQESYSKGKSSEAGVEIHSLGLNKPEKETRIDLPSRNVNESDDSSCTADLDLRSMIVLDEVGKCSDDNKSEGSIMDVSGHEHHLGYHSSDGRASQGSYKVNSFKLYVRNINVDRKVPQYSENVIINSDSKEKYSEPEKVLNRSEVQCSDMPFFQCSVNQNNLINCVGRKDNILSVHEHFISVNRDSQENYNCIKENRICDKILVKDSNCIKCNSNFSDQCTCNVLNENFKNKQLTYKEKTESNSSERTSDTYVELSDIFRPLLANSNDKIVDNADPNSIDTATSNFSLKNREKIELGSSDKKETIPDGFLSVSEKIFMEPVTDDNETHESQQIISNSQFPLIGMNERVSHFIENESQECGDKYNSPDPNISVEENEEVLRLGLLAMLNKNSLEPMSKNSLSSPQTVDPKENIPSRTDITCDSGNVKNIILEHQIKKASLPPPNNVSSLKSTKGNVPMNLLLPSKSSCVNPKVYPHHVSLTHTKLVFPCRNKLISVNKRGAKSNKTRMIKNSSSGRSNINVPELVINLGEDSDSGDDVSDLCALNESNNASSKRIDSQSATQDVPPDFAKKLDMLLKQARFEQEGVSSEEKDDSGDNDQMELTKYVDVSSVSAEEVSESLKGAIENSSVSDYSIQDKLVNKESVVSTSLPNNLDNSATICVNTALTKEKVFTYNQKDTSKISSHTNRKKIIIPEQKKNITTNFVSPALPVVDIGLLPSCKQKEYLKLKRQLAQFAQKVDPKAKENLEIKNILGNKNKNADKALQRLVRRNVVKNNCAANIDRTSFTRKLIRRVQVGSQTSRNEIIKSRKLVKTISSVNNVQPQVPVRISSTSLNKEPPQLLCSPDCKIPLLQKKVTNSSVCMRKSTAVQFTSTVKQKKSPTVISRFSTGKSDELREVTCNKFVVKSNQQRREIDPFSVKSCVPEEKSLSLKRKKSISESSSVPVSKKCSLKLQTTTIPSCNKEENIQNKEPNSSDANETPENNINRALAEELWMSENKLMAKRYQVLEDLASVRVHLHEIERVNVVKQQILLDIKMLREKIHFAESQLSQKDELLSTLYSEVEDGKRNIMRGQSETLLLSVECEEKGCKVHGPDYSVPNICTEMIRKGMLSISKTLQSLKENKDSIESICGMSSICSPGEKPHAAGNGQHVSGSVDNTSDEEKKQVQHSYSSPLDAIRTQSGRLLGP